jgi:hypothetical protein
VGGEVRSRDREEGTGGVAEVPCKSIGVGIEVAGSAAHGAVGREPGIEEEAACFGDRARESRVGTDRAFVDHLAVRGVDDREGIGQFPENVEPRGGGVQGESTWAAHLAASGRRWPEVGNVCHAAVGGADAGDAVRGEGGDPEV